MAAGPRAVASHRAAGALWGFDGMAQGRPEVTVTTSGARELRGVAVHHSRSVRRPDRAVRDGIPCTSAARTLIDLAAVLSPDELEVALDSALREHLTSVGYLRRRLHAQGRKGTGVLRDLLEDRVGQRPRESPKEADLARLLVAAGVPAPVRQFELWHEGVFVARFDLAWPDTRIAVEFQSYRHHFGRYAWRRDAGRANRAVAAGWRVFMATDEDVRDGCRRLVAHVASACAA